MDHSVVLMHSVSITTIKNIGALQIKRINWCKYPKFVLIYKQLTESTRDGLIELSIEHNNIALFILSVSAFTFYISVFLANKRTY